VLEVACVNWGTKYDPRYVEILEAAVKRNLKAPHEFVCFTDNPKNYRCKTRTLPKGLEGWWNKLFLFSKGCFDSRVLFLDLDICVTGSLDELVEIPSPFCIIEDWHVPGYNSSVFVMDPDSHTEVWEDFNSTEGFPGDQDWITHKIPNAPVFPSGWCVSYRSHAVPGVPRGTKVVVFHGTPKPHEFPSYWVKDYWAT
jgi:hypothetical protein